MKRENQVCTLDQAKKLKELGIEQVGINLYAETTIGTLLLYKTDMPSTQKEYSAFSVAELGETMKEVDNGNIDVTCFYNWHMGFWDCVISRPNDDTPEILGNEFECDTEAQVRADALIYLIEHEYLTADDCNSALNES